LATIADLVVKGKIKVSVETVLPLQSKPSKRKR
jgi:hypothetical protein